MSQVTFRQAGMSDIAQLVKLRSLFVAESDAAKSNNHTPEFAQAAFDYFSEALSNHSYFGAVAEFDGRLVGNAGLVLYRKPPSFRGRSGIVGYITNVYTVPEFRNRGLATELMKLVIQQARHAGVEKLHLGTSPDGRRLYEKLGFKDVSVPALELRL